MACMNSEEDRDALQQQVAHLRRQLADAERRLRLIGFEIHDGLVQDLAGAAMFLDAAKKDATYSCPEGLQNVERGMQLVRSAIGEARRLIGGLDTPLPQVDSLTAAVRALIERMQHDHGLRIDFTEPLHEPHLTSAARATMLRVIREALNNAWQHSQSPRAEVTLHEEAGHLVATVRDWGVGFDPRGVHPGRYGLKSIRERAELLEGTAAISSKPGQGTTVRFSLPLEDSETTAE